MRIVVDTNVVMSAVFFGGPPLRLLGCLLDDTVKGVASPEIVEEYREVAMRLSSKYPDRPLRLSLSGIVTRLDIVEPNIKITVCRDADDDKFLSCAKAGKCLYIVSGDNDLLTLGEVSGVRIVTVTEFLASIVGCS